MATKDSIMKQSIFFWVIEHRLSFEYGFKKFLFGAWRNLSGALRELILNDWRMAVSEFEAFTREFYIVVIGTWEIIAVSEFGGS